MIKHFLRTVLIAGSVCVIWIALFVFCQPAAEATFTLLEPWRELCQVITPDAWQTRGNILLGMMWAFSGVVVYSIAAGGASAALVAVAETIWRRTMRCTAAE